MAMAEKFQSLFETAKGEQRGFVPFTQLKTLWFNTGTVCNLACENCYIESSPRNDRLSFLNHEDVAIYLNEIEQEGLKTELIGLTGGEPFANPHIANILEQILKRGHKVLVLTNAFKAIKRHHPKLLELNKTYLGKLQLRVSLDHFSSKLHEKERGAGTFVPTLIETKWLCDQGFDVSIAGRALFCEEMGTAIRGYKKLFEQFQINFAGELSEKLVIFPEMISNEDVPEISIHCFDILGKKPEDQMCSTERMVVKRKGESQCVVLPCTLLAYEKQFELSHTLADSFKDVYLNHPFCAKFCVLGSSSCSSTA